MKKGLFHDYKGNDHGYDEWELKPAVKKARNWALALGAAATFGAAIHDVLEDDGTTNPTHQEAEHNDK